MPLISAFLSFLWLSLCNEKLDRGKSLNLSEIVELDVLNEIAQYIASFFLEKWAIEHTFLLAQEVVLVRPFATMTK
jgi:hypothetical protein